MRSHLNQVAKLYLKVRRWASERFVVTVEFKPKPAAMAFRKLLDENAQISCEREPGYRPFAVPAPIGERSHLAL
jgi:hypothetical protein